MLTHYVDITYIISNKTSQPQHPHDTYTIELHTITIQPRITCPIHILHLDYHTTYKSLYSYTYTQFTLLIKYPSVTLNSCTSIHKPILITLQLQPGPVQTDFHTSASAPMSVHLQPRQLHPHQCPIHLQPRQLLPASLSNCACSHTNVPYMCRHCNPCVHSMSRTPVATPSTLLTPWHISPSSLPA